MAYNSLIILLIATTLAFLSGWLWYGPLFGKVWRKAQPHRKARDMKNAPLGMLVQILHLLATAIVIFAIIQGTAIAISAINAAVIGFLMLATMTGLGMLSGGIFLGHKRNLILINIGYQMLVLAILAVAAII